MDYNGNLKALFVIINAGHADEVVELLRENGAKGATILNSRGEGVRHESFMGITIDLEKEMILCVVDEATANKAMAAIKEKQGLQTPAHSVCFTMPIDRTLGIDMPLAQE